MSEDRFIIQSVVRWKNPFNGSTEDKNTFITVEGQRLENFKAFKESLGIIDNHGLFTFQYYDDDDDQIPISSENEFTEFAKVVKKRTVRGMVTRLFVHCDIPLEDKKKPNQEEKIPSESPLVPRAEPTMSEGTSTAVVPEGTSTSLEDKEKPLSNLPLELFQAAAVLDDKKFKKIVKEHPELMQEMQEARSACSSSSLSNSKENEKVKNAQLNKMSKYLMAKRNEFILKRNVTTSTERKLEEKEELKESKQSKHSFNIKAMLDLPYELPAIMSAEGIKEFFVLSKPVVVGKSFVHTWVVTNDGTRPWKNVELRHTWSSAGLEPKKLSIKCQPLNPGQQCQLEVKFKAPTVVTQLLSIWNFFYEVNSQWIQFGHYVSVTGPTKEKKIANSVNTPTESHDELTTPQSKPNEEAILVTEVQSSSSRTKLDENLASAKIAAEMEMEAVRIAKETALSKKSSNNILKIANFSDKVAVKDLGPNSSDSDSETEELNNTPDDFEIVTVDNCKDDVATKPPTVNETRQCENTPISESSSANCAKSGGSEPGPLMNFDEVQDINNPPLGCAVDVTNPYFTNQYTRRFGYFTRDGYAEIPPYDVGNMPANCYQPMYPTNDVVYQQCNPPYQPYHPYDTNPLKPVVYTPFYPAQTPQAVQTAPHAYTQTQTFHNVTQTIPTVEPQVEIVQPLLASNATTPQNLPAVRTAPHTHTQTQTAHHVSQPIPTVKPQVEIVQPRLATNTATTVTDNGLINVATNQESTAVHLLPQGLVEGAINVASSAYSTARKALNNLRPPESDSIKDFDPVFENNFALLVEMGFNNFERNARLLKRFNNDIDKVIGIICATPDGNNLEID